MDFQFCPWPAQGLAHGEGSVNLGDIEGFIYLFFNDSKIYITHNLPLFSVQFGSIVVEF